MLNVLMPSLGLTMEEGIVVEWLVKVGDTVAEGKPLLIIESEKSTLEINSPYSGVLNKIIVDEGVTVPVGEVIAWIESDDSTEMPVQGNDAKIDSAPVLPPKESRVPSSESKAVKASPLARKLADQYQIDISKVTGTGPGGRITKEDVESARSSTSKGTALTGIRRIIAERMAESSRQTAAVTLTCRVRANKLVAARAVAIERMAGDGLRPSYNDLIAVVVRDALIQIPEVNVLLDGDTISRNTEVNIGIAVDTPDGLKVPVLKNVEKMDLKALVTSSRDLVERTNESRLLPDEMSGGTFTITNLGMYDIEFFTPIINAPECSILGVGTISDVPVVSDGQIGIEKQMPLSLTFDHRAFDGAPAARFLKTIKDSLERIDIDSIQDSRGGQR